MNVLTTRALSYPDERGNHKELILMVSMPLEVKEYHWNCGFVTDPPMRPQIVHGVGIDFIQAFVECLRVVRLYFETVERSRRVHWQGMPDCGLPKYAEEPAPLGLKDIPPPLEIRGSRDILTTRAVGYRNESGDERELLLTVFVPFKADDETWSCGFTFDSPPFASIRYGVGADFIEALLDSLAKARTTFEGTAPKGWRPSEGEFNCDDLPYKIGRSFWLARDRPSAPETPDASAG